MPQISVNQFKSQLRDGVKRVAEERHLNIDNSTQRGYAFQYWLAEIISSYEVGFDTTEPEDACIISNDLGIDIVFEDPDRNHILLCQAKYQALGKPLLEGEVNDFFARHDRLCDRSWVVKHAADRASEALADYGEKIANGYSATYYFFSTGEASQRIHDLAASATTSYANRGIPARCEVYDFTKLKEYYIRSLSIEESGPPEVVLRLPKGRFFEKTDPLPTVVAVLKGNELRGLYQRYKESLYAWNIRGYLGNRGINQEIYHTAQSRPEYFFYFNNGVSAICTSYTIADENELRAKNLQIINGAQTISTLAKADANPGVDVLFRLTKTESVKTEKGMNRDIIQFNNTQNAIKVSDFRSNDEIQLWLEERFKKLKSTSVIPDLHYLRKRSVGRRGVGYGLKLEEFAKIRYSFLKEPTLVHASPKNLWTSKEDQGAYEIALGVDGELQSAWSDSVFHESVLAIVLYGKIDQATKDSAKKSPELRFLKRLRFHALSLAGTFYREQEDPPIPYELLHNNSEFIAYWHRFWNMAWPVIVDVYQNALEQDSTMFAFVRSDDRWEQMKKRFRLRLAMSS